MVISVSFVGFKKVTVVFVALKSISNFLLLLVIATSWGLLVIFPIVVILLVFKVSRRVGCISEYESVILLALGLIRQHTIGLSDCLELLIDLSKLGFGWLFCFRHYRVGMVFLG